MRERRIITPHSRQPLMFPPSPGNDQWMLAEDIAIEIHAAVDVWLHIDAGFLFDGASIPRFFWRTIGHPMLSDYLTPALCHDAAYAAEIFGFDPEGRDEADCMFARLLSRWGVGCVKRLCMYLAVRFFGGYVWDAHSAAGVMNARRLVRLA